MPANGRWDLIRRLKFILYLVLSTFHHFPPMHCPLPADFLIGSQDSFRLSPENSRGPPPFRSPRASDGLATWPLNTLPTDQIERKRQRSFC